MNNLIEGPLSQLMHFYGNMDPKKKSEEKSDSPVEGKAAGEPAAKAAIAAVEPIEMVGAATAANEARLAEECKLNVNANVFVPRSEDFSSAKMGDELSGPFKQALEVGHKPVQPKLIQLWKDFPKSLNPDGARKSHVKVVEVSPAVADENAKPATIKKHSTKAAVPDEKQREQERKVALEAIKLVEQRRMREPVEQPQDIIHLTRSPVAYTPEERQRVNRLRLIKREHIERVLREMAEDTQLKTAKQQQTGARYICLKPYPEKPSEKPEPQQPQANVMSKRYIPTAKQWDERCRAKAAASATKENNVAGMRPAKSQKNGATGRPVSTTSSSAATAPIQSKSGEVFVPRYTPPIPVGQGSAKIERRRGNITHAQNVKSFPKCGLLPTPSTPPVWPSPAGAKPIKRYNIKQLLDLEPYPEQLEKPNIPESLSQLYYI